MSRENATFHHAVHEQQTTLSETEQWLKEALDHVDALTRDVQLVRQQLIAAEKAVRNDPLAEREKEILSGDHVHKKGTALT